MKNCFIVMILFLGLAFNGSSTTASSNKGFKHKLKEYIKEQKSSAQTASSISWIPFSGSLLNVGSKYYEKGNSVDKNELELLIKIDDSEYERAIAILDMEKIESLAYDIYSKIKYIKDPNKWHDQLYDYISEYNDPGISRKEAIKRKLAQRDDAKVQEQFVFGIAVTMVVEDMMKTKK